MIYSESLSVLNLLFKAMFDNGWHIKRLCVANEETRQLLKKLMEAKH